MDRAELRHLTPDAALRPFLGLFHLFEAPGDVDGIERAGGAQLRFRLSPGPASYAFVDGHRQEAPPVHVIGATTGAMRVRADGPVRVFGVGLSPLGWTALTGCRAADLADRCVDAAALLDAGVMEAAAALRGCADAEAMRAALEPWLRRRLAGEHGAVVTFIDAVDAWLAGAASPVLAGLVATTGLSRRQVERRCNALYGCPPKLLARKVRALRAAAAIARGEEAPPDCFYDQSHLIREVKRFTGLTPGRLRSVRAARAAGGDATSRMVGTDRDAGGRHPALT